MYLNSAMHKILRFAQDDWMTNQTYVANLRNATPAARDTRDSYQGIALAMPKVPQN
jgi:hypothetical protein